MQLLRAVSALTLLLAMTLHSSKLLATLHLVEVMTLDEQKKTGIYSLSSLQKEELERWLNTKFILKTTSTAAPTLQENLRNGSEIMLSDGSSFAIDPADQFKASSWISPVMIKISPSGDPLYPLLLTNTLTGVSVKAKKIETTTK